MTYRPLTQIYPISPIGNSFPLSSRIVTSVDGIGMPIISVGRYTVAGVPCNKVSEPPSGRRQQISPRRRDQSLQLCQSYEFCELVGEGLKHDDGLRTGIFDPTLKVVRRVERIDIDDDEPCPEHAEEGHRILRQLRQLSPCAFGKHTVRLPISNGIMTDRFRSTSCSQA